MPLTRKSCHSSSWPQRLSNLARIVTDTTDRQMEVFTLVNAQVHRQGMCSGSDREWQHQHIFDANHYLFTVSSTYYTNAFTIVTTAWHLSCQKTYLVCVTVVLSSVVWVIFVVVVDFVLPLYDPIGVNTSTFLSVVSVTILAKLDKRCGHEDKWQDLLVSGMSSVILVNVQVHRQGMWPVSNREWQHRHIFHANHYIYLRCHLHTTQTLFLF